MDSSELARFIAHIASDSNKEERQAAIDHLLRVVDLTPDQVQILAASGPVHRVVGLQLSIRRYATSKQFEAARQAAANETAWQRTLDFLAAVIPS
jgi:hypothetical protein